MHDYHVLLQSVLNQFLYRLKYLAHSWLYNLHQIVQLLLCLYFLFYSKYDADTAKLKTDHDADLKKLKDASAEEVKKLTDKFAADAKKVTDDHLAAVKKLPEASDAAVKDEQFAWTPPASARELTAAAMAQDDGGGAGAALVGKPAPEFKLSTPEGKDVSLADQKGHVVVVDFWATWCGPCVASLPHLNKLYEDKKEAGLKVLAISVDEDKTKVPPFVAAKKLTLTVLLDNDEQKVAEKYGVMGIPQTVVIGKDGTVKKVFVGFGPGSEDELRKVVEEAMK